MKCVVPHEVGLKRVAFFVAAFLQAMFGALTLVFHEEIFGRLLNSQLVIREGTEAYKAWIATPIPVYTKFYLFSIQNPEDFLAKRSKPILEEMGPYTFREHEEKVDLVWNTNNHTVSYRRQKTWWFEPELSVGPLTDTVTTVNLPMLAASDAARGDFFMEFGLTDMFSAMEAQLFIKKTVGELLFDGYEDDLVTIGDAMSSNSQIPMDKFGWFYKRNGTSWSDGRLSMHTGEDDISLLGRIDTWNGKTRTAAFPGECGRLSGSSDGLLAPGYLAMRDEFQIWSTDSCRPLTFERAGQSVMHGIHTDQFQLSPTVFANSTECPGNQCYNNNLPTGVQNVTQCKVKSPAFLSRPHFHLADSSYAAQFESGIQADPQRHDSHFLIEPLSSIPLKISMRLQLNLLLEKNDGISYLMNKLPRLMLPVMWFETEAELPEALASPLALLVNMPVIMKGCGFAGILLGLAGMISMLVCVVRLRPAAADKPELAGREESMEDPEYARVLLKESEELSTQCGSDGSILGGSQGSTLRGSEDSLLP